MTRIEATTTVRASPERVWAFISSPERYPEWARARLFGVLNVGTIDMLSVSETPISEGAVYHERGRLGPVTFEGEWQIINWEPPHRQTHLGEFAGVTTTLEFYLDPTAGGTKVRQTIDASPLSRMYPLGGWIERKLAHRLVAPFLRRVVLNMKTIVETEHHRTTGERYS